MRPALGAALWLCLAAAVWTAAPAIAKDGDHDGDGAAKRAACHLGNGVKHVFHLTCDDQ
jgi:hypothetical protein